MQEESEPEREATATGGSRQGCSEYEGSSLDGFIVDDGEVEELGPGGGSSGSEQDVSLVAEEEAAVEEDLSEGAAAQRDADAMEEL